MREKHEPWLPVSEQAKAWAAALAAEIREWPEVTQKSFFGFTALYRERYMFGLLPRTKSIFTANAVAFRFEPPNPKTKALLENDPQIAPFDKHRERWYTLELTCDADLHRALDWLGRACEHASKGKAQKKARKKRRK